MFTVISHLSVGAHSIDEEAFQSTMKYIFAFIEKVRLLASVLVLSLTYGRPAGEASREHCREAVPAVPDV